MFVRWRWAETEHDVLCADRSKDSQLFVFLLKSGQKARVLTDLFVSVNPVCPSASSPNIKIWFALSLRLQKSINILILTPRLLVLFVVRPRRVGRYEIFSRGGSVCYGRHITGRDLRLNRICLRSSTRNLLRSETRNTRPAAPQNFSGFTVWFSTNGATILRPARVYSSSETSHLELTALYLGAFLLNVINIYNTNYHVNNDNGLL